LALQHFSAQSVSPTATRENHLSSFSLQTLARIFAAIDLPSGRTQHTSINSQQSNCNATMDQTTLHARFNSLSPSLISAPGFSPDRVLDVLWNSRFCVSDNFPSQFCRGFCKGFVEAVACVDGGTFNDYLQQRVLPALNMVRTTVSIPPRDPGYQSLYIASRCHTTANDVFS